MKNAREEIDGYLALWDEAQKQFATEKKPIVSKGSFFGMKDNVVSEDITEEDGEHWRDIYYRSLEIDPDTFEDQTINEEEIDQQCLAGMMDIQEAKEAKAKAKNKKTKPKKKKKEADPRKPKDGDDAPELDPELDGFGKDLATHLGNVKYSPNPCHFASIGKDQDLRVTPNFSDGDELRKLTALKQLLYDLESELLGTDVRGGDPEPIRVKLMAAQRQCEELSQALTPDPKTDVS